MKRVAVGAALAQQQLLIGFANAEALPRTHSFCSILIQRYAAPHLIPCKF
jgi:hypothetical protein